MLEISFEQFRQMAQRQGDVGDAVTDQSPHQHFQNRYVAERHNGLGKLTVNGASRVPLPPARMTARSAGCGSPDLSCLAHTMYSFVR